MREKFFERDDLAVDLALTSLAPAQEDDSLLFSSSVVLQSTGASLSATSRTDEQREIKYRRNDVARNVSLRVSWRTDEAEVVWSAKGAKAGEIYWLGVDARTKGQGAQNSAPIPRLWFRLGDVMAGDGKGTTTIPFQAFGVDPNIHQLHVMLHVETAAGDPV